MSNNEGLTRRRLSGLALAGAVAGLAGPRLAHAQTAKRVLIVQGSSTMLLSFAPSYLAEDLGFYKDEGLAVERLLATNGPTGFTALMSGSGTILLSAPGELLAAASRGQKLKVLCAESDYQSTHLIVSKDYAAKHGITATTPYKARLAAARGMKGIRVGLSSAGSFTDLNARAALRGAGLDPDKDAQLLPLGTVPNLIAALGRGRIDAMQAATPAPETAESELGAVPLFSVGRGEVPDFKTLSGNLIMARLVDVERDPSLYQALVRADVRALRYIVEKPDLAGAQLHKSRYPSMSDELWKLVWNQNKDQFRTPYVTQASIEAWVSLNAVPNMLDAKAIDYGQIVDMRFVNEAVKAIGWTVPT